MIRNRVLSFVVLVTLLLVGCSGEPLPTVVGSPTDVAATAQYGIVTVSWQYSGAAPDEFEVWRSEAGGGNSSLLGTAPATERSYVDTSPEYSQAYVYEVMAKDASESFASLPSGSVTAEPGVALSVGTYRWQTNSTAFASFGFYLFLDPNELSGGSAKFTIEGPPGWNNDAPYERTYSHLALSMLNYVNASTTNIEAKVGTYTLTVSDSASSEVLFEADPVTLDSLSMLEPLAGVATLTSTSLSAAWDGVGNGGPYMVRLYQGLYDSVVNDWLIDPSDPTTLDIGGLTLAPGNYAVSIFSYADEDFSDDDRRAPVPRHDVAGWLVWPLSIE